MEDFFLFDFIFLLIVTITNRAEMDQISNTVKTLIKKHSTQSYIKIPVNSANSSCLYLSD